MRTNEVIPRLLAKHGFKNEKVFELMFVTPINSMPPVSAGDLRGVKSRKGKKKWPKCWLLKKGPMVMVEEETMMKSYMQISKE